MYGQEFSQLLATQCCWLWLMIDVKVIKSLIKLNMFNISGNCINHDKSVSRLHVTEVESV